MEKKLVAFFSKELNIFNKTIYKKFSNNKFKVDFIIRISPNKKFGELMKSN